MLKDEINLLAQLKILNFITLEYSFKTNLDLFFLSLAWVWIINLFNFMDGMDGITSVQVISLSIFTNILAIIGIIEINFSFILV